MSTFSARAAIDRRLPMTRLAALTIAEARLLMRDWTVIVFAFLFPPFTMLILAGVFGTERDEGFAMQRPDDYYVVASIAVPIVALAVIGLPVALASYRERGVLRRFAAFGVPPSRVVAAQALVTWALVAVGAVLVLAVAAPTYGIPSIDRPLQTALGLLAATATLTLIGIAIGLAAPTARAAQAIGLLAFFPLYLLGGGGPPKDAMSGAMRSISDALPSAVPALTDPWLGVSGIASQLVVFAAWAAAASLAIAWLVRRVEA
ncbi:MAG TPA: ABC transporter permease [Conexibacter sp.]|jgi:ABC-2 type transport system permease protein